MAVDSIEGSWLAGLLEGEGSFRYQRVGRSMTLRIKLEMTDEDVVRRAAKVMGSTVRKDKPRPPRKPSYRTEIGCDAAAMIMSQVLPMMGQRRSEKIRSCLHEWNAYRLRGRLPLGRRMLSEDQVLEIRASPESSRHLSARYGISGRSICQIKRAASYRDIPMADGSLPMSGRKIDDDAS